MGRPADRGDVGTLPHDDDSDDEDVDDRQQQQENRPRPPQPRPRPRRRKKGWRLKDVVLLVALHLALELVLVGLPPAAEGFLFPPSFPVGPLASIPTVAVLSAAALVFIVGAALLGLSIRRFLNRTRPLMTALMRLAMLSGSFDDQSVNTIQQLLQNGVLTQVASFSAADVSRLQELRTITPNQLARLQDFATLSPATVNAVRELTPRQLTLLSQLGNLDPNVINRVMQLTDADFDVLLSTRQINPEVLQRLVQLTPDLLDKLIEFGAIDRETLRTVMKLDPERIAAFNGIDIKAIQNFLGISDPNVMGIGAGTRQENRQQGKINTTNLDNSQRRLVQLFELTGTLPPRLLRYPPDILKDSGLFDPLPDEIKKELGILDLEEEEGAQSASNSSTRLRRFSAVMSSLLNVIQDPLLGTTGQGGWANADHAGSHYQYSQELSGPQVDLSGQIRRSSSTAAVGKDSPKRTWMDRVVHSARETVSSGVGILQNTFNRVRHGFMEKIRSRTSSPLPVQSVPITVVEAAPVSSGHDGGLIRFRPTAEGQSESPWPSSLLQHRRQHRRRRRRRRQIRDKDEVDITRESEARRPAEPIELELVALLSFLEEIDDGIDCGKMYVCGAAASREAASPRNFEDPEDPESTSSKAARSLLASWSPKSLLDAAELGKLSRSVEACKSLYNSCSLIAGP